MQEQVETRKLDNAANLFPAIADYRDPHVYRVTIILRDQICGRVLQIALDQTLPYFKAFAVRLQSHWACNYFTENLTVNCVNEETLAPCQYFDPDKPDGFLFRILYYRKRVHLEVFHAITDGTGAIQFLKALCYRYCQLTYPQDFTSEQRTMRYGIQGAGYVLDAYHKNYARSMKRRIYKEPSAFHIQSAKQSRESLGILSAMIPIQEIKKESARFHATITEYLTAVIATELMTTYNNENKTNQPININLPVNLRPIFQTDTAVNFFTTATIVFDPSKFTTNFDSILKEVKVQLKEKIARQALERKLAFTVSGEKSLLAQIAPLPLRNWFLRFMYSHFNDGNTLSLSNLGLIEAESIFTPYIQGFRVVWAPTPKEPIKITICSYKGELALTFTSALEDNDLACNILRYLSQNGISVTIETGGDLYE